MSELNNAIENANITSFGAKMLAKGIADNAMRNGVSEQVVKDTIKLVIGDDNICPDFELTTLNTTTIREGRRIHRVIYKGKC